MFGQSKIDPNTNNSKQEERIQKESEESDEPEDSDELEDSDKALEDLEENIPDLKEKGSVFADNKDPEKVESHEFSVPWRNSDVVLIIEEQKIHVHRLILEMVSPVLCHRFKESDAAQVPLFRTNVNDFVELLRVIYPQFESKISLNNVERIYRLAEEYQIDGVLKLCCEFLTLTKKTSMNAMDILVAAQTCNADEARQQCYKELQNLTVAELKSQRGFTYLDEQSLLNVLLPKAEHLEECLKKIQPQLVGLIDCVLYLWFHESNSIKMNGIPKKCPVHHSSAVATTPMKTRIKCSACQAMFAQMARNSKSTAKQPMQTSTSTKRMKAPKAVQSFDYGSSSLFESVFSNSFDFRHSASVASSKTGDPFYSDCGMYFNERIVDILQEMFSLLHS